VRALPARPDDYPIFCRLFTQLGVDDPIPDEERWRDRQMEHTLVLRRGNDGIGYVTFKAEGVAGHVAQIVIDTPHRGRGCGRFLLLAAAERLRQAGCDRWWLNVKIDNDAGLALYRRVGMEVAYRAGAFEIGWEQLAALPGGTERVHARLLRYDEEAAEERALGLPSGRLSSSRARAPGVVMLRLVDEERPDDHGVGVLGFDPTFPGAFLVRVAGPDGVRPLLSALRSYARSSEPGLKLLLEDSPLADAALRAAGAKVRFALYRMEGPLPLDRPPGCD
jgi:ribosomal-protein-alanine N-acetyltransferase